MTGESYREGYPKILFFSSKHCGPCEGVEAQLRRINISMFGKRLNIDKINIDIKENRELMQRYKISSVPTLIIGEQRLSVDIQEEDIIDAILQAFIDSVQI